jgi:predicted ATPase/class 3 adenylate cyclase
LNLPTGTVTFLFTDIEGSTLLWEQHPEAMKAALARHDALLRRAIRACGGAVFKTMGDAFCAAFAEAAGAVKATLLAQFALRAEAAGAVGPLRVRMALHTGAAEERDGDYFGPTLNRAARLLAAAHGGQMLLSSATQEAVHADLPEGVSLRDLGLHRLRDLARPERIFQLVHPDLPAEFPPLRSLEAFAHNLPVQLTSFIGREREMAEVRRLLATTHLLTLTGAGGSGKTRLALQIAADLVEEYTDGVWLVELAALSSPALVPQAVAAVLGVREEPGRPLTQTLADCLRPKSLLLLLDNCEHLLSACAPLISSLLSACAKLRILATSREGLSIVGEQTYRVPSLSLPDPNDLPPLESLRECEGVRLFVDRAILGQPTFTITEANAAGVAQVCRRLDGIPLAIELAAARVRALSVEQIAARLDDRFRLLTGGSRAALPRQQTLRSLIDWSYDLLTEPERALLRRLSVFAGGWSLDAAEAVCADFGLSSDQPPIQNPKSEIQHEEVLELLTQLVDKSLVVYEEQTGLRYRLLETVRQYARDRLLDANEADAVRDQHLSFFLGLAEAAAGPLDKGPGAWAGALEPIILEYENLCAALEWCESNEANTVSGLRLATALVGFWWGRGYLSVGQGHLTALLSRPGGAGCTIARARAVEGASKLAYLRSELDIARSLGEESLALWQELGDARGIIRSLRALGHVALSQRDPVRARAMYEESLARSQELGDEYYLALSFDSLGSVVAVEGDPAAASSLHEEALSLYRRLNHWGGVAWTLCNLGRVAALLGDHTRAVALC